LCLLIQELFGSKEFLAKIRSQVNESYTFHETREVNVKMPFGTTQKLKSHYFRNVSSTSSKSKKNEGKGTHIFLDLLGFENLCSQELFSKSAKMNAICPSAQIASNLLKDDGIILSQNKIREMSNSFTNLSFSQRAQLCCDKNESFAGKRVLLCVDGGRVNGRFPKKGPQPKGAKGKCFNSDWKEAKLFTLYTLKDNGEIDPGCAPLVDGVTGDHEQLTKLLKEYLKEMEISKCKEITVVCDGASWHWIRLPLITEESQS